MRFIRAFLLVVVLVFVVGAAFVASGIYQVAADEPHWALTEATLNVLRNRSVETHAHGIVVPNLDDPKRVAEGAEHYAGMCTGCHLAPGKRDSDLRAGLYPKPPNLTEPASQIDPAKMFWIIKHGVKLTAMPAWGKSHTDDQIWNLVAFVKKLPTLSPEQYQQATANTDEHEHHHHDHDADSSEHADHADHEQPTDHEHPDSGGPTH